MNSLWHFGPLKDMAWTEYGFDSLDVLEIMMPIKITCFFFSQNIHNRKANRDLPLSMFLKYSLSIQVTEQWHFRGFNVESVKQSCT